MMSKTKWFVAGVVVLLIVGTVAMKWRGDTVNTRVMNEIRSDPFGERARKTMIATLDDGRVYPVNYLREDGRVYMGIDGLWWRVFQGEGSRVQMEINDQIVTGTGVVILDDPARVDDVFSRLRPTVPEWLPQALNGKLVEITPDSEWESHQNISQ
jgi:hypothetical protein